MIKNVFIRIFSVMIAVIMVVICGVSAGDKYDVRDPETCKLNFAVISDTHIEGNNFTRYKVFEHSLQDLRRNQSGNDAVIFLGDNTMNGQIIENSLFHGTASILMKDQKVLPVMGNHDIGNGNGDYATLQQRWYDYTASAFGLELEHPYYYDVIEGCYFIVLGMESQLVHEMYMSEEQFTWLDGVLAEAAKSGKPAFVFSHYPTDYVIDADGNETDRLTETLAAYNEEHDLFYFAGHTHMPMYLFWSFHNSDGFPQTYLPRITQLSGSDDEVYDDTGVGLEVEIYEDHVELRARDFYRGEWKYDTADTTMCEVSYDQKVPVRN